MFGHGYSKYEESAKHHGSHTKHRLSSETNTSFAINEFPTHTHCLRHRVHIRTPRVPILSHVHSVYALLYFFQNHVNIISLLLLDLSSGLFPSGFITEALDALLFNACNMPCPSHPQFFRLSLRPVCLSQHFVLQHHKSYDLLRM